MLQAKHNERYLCFLITHQRILVNRFNIFLAICSTSGALGWKVWDLVPVIACVIVSAVSLSKLVQPYIIPSEKQIEKLDKANDHYYDQFYRLERLLMDMDAREISEMEAKNEFMKMKQSEREINKILNEVHRRINAKIHNRAEKETREFVSVNYKTE